MPRIHLSDLKPKIWSKQERDRIEAVEEASIERAVVKEPFLEAYSADDAVEARKSGNDELASRMDRVSEATRKRRGDFLDTDAEARRVRAKHL